MAKKKFDYRAHQAHKRNQQKIADARAQQKQKEFFQQHGKQLLIGAAAAVVLIIAIWLGCKWFVGPGGSIPNWFGTLRNVEENWIIANTGESNSPRYFKLGEYTAPEGYTLDADYVGSADALSQSQFYNANDAAAPVQTLYVAGVGASAQEQLNTVMLYYPENTGVNQATIAGHDVYYTYVTQETTVNQTHTHEDGTVHEADAELPEEERTGASMLVMYADSVQDACVLVMLNADEKPLKEVVAEETLMAEAEKFLSLLKVEK